MTLGAGGASLVSSGQVAGGATRNKGLVTASPSVSGNPDALALQEMPHVEYEDYEPLDFEVEKLPITQEEKRQLMLAFRGSGVLVQDETGRWLACSLDDTRPATQEEMSRLPRITTKRLEARRAVLESFAKVRL